MSRIKSMGGQAPQMPMAVVARPAVAATADAADTALDERASQASATPPAAEASTPEPQHLEDLIAHIQSKVAAFAPGLEFAVDQSSGKSVVKVTDTATNDVVWQFPSVAAIQISKELDQFQKGVLMHRQV